MKQSNTFLKAVAMLFIAVIFVSPLYSQSGPRSVSIRLQQPPPNLLNISNLWKATLTNNTKAPIKIYLEGYAEEQKGGRIVEGRTEVFTLPPSKSTYQYDDFKTGTVNWVNKKYEEPIIRTGTAPSGTYTICMTAKNEKGEIVGLENCITHIVDIKTESEITLISPEDGEELVDNNLTFIWSPPFPLPLESIKYVFKLVEVRSNQSIEDAIKNNSILYKKELTSTTFKYPLTAPLLKSEIKYAWDISFFYDNKIIMTNPNSFEILSMKDTVKLGMKSKLIKCSFLDIYYLSNTTNLPYITIKDLITKIQSVWNCRNISQYGLTPLHEERFGQYTNDYNFPNKPYNPFVNCEDPYISAEFSWEGVTKEKLEELLNCASNIANNNIPYCQLCNKNKSIKKIIFGYDMSVGKGSYFSACNVIYCCNLKSHIKPNIEIK